MMDNKLDAAYDKFTKVIELDPNWSEAWNKRATAYFMMGNFDLSMKDISQTLQLEPRHFGAISGLVQINMFFKNYSEALKNLDYVILINPFINIQQIRPDILKLIKKSSI